MSALPVYNKRDLGLQPFCGTFEVGALIVEQSPVAAHKTFVNNGNISFTGPLGPDGLPDFPISSNDRTRRNQRKTAFGENCWGNMQMPNCGNQGLREALWRLCKVRESDRPGYHWQLIANQIVIIDRLGVVFTEFARWFLFETRVNFDVEYDTMEAREKWAYAEHPKKKERISSYLKMVDSGVVFGFDNINKIEVAPKPCELVAQGPDGDQKVGRVTGNFGPSAAMLFGPWADMFKKALERPYAMGAGTMRFLSSASIDNLESAFDEMLNCPVGEFRIIYHSDDVCAAMSTSEGLLFVNADISACDGSHTEALMVAMRTLMMQVDVRASDDIFQTFKQLYHPFIVLSDDKKFRSKGVPNGPILYSGSTLTTLMNCFAVCLACLRFSTLYRAEHGKNQCSDALVDSFADAGYVLKNVVCDKIERIQLLKRSPSLVDGVVVPWLNLGAWLKGWGTCDGDLPGSSRIPLKVRAHRWNREVAMSRKHEGNHIFSRLFFMKYVGSCEELQGPYIPTESLARRYGCSPIELEELASLLVEAGFGSWVCHPVLSKIYGEDYGAP